MALIIKVLSLSYLRSKSLTISEAPLFKEGISEPTGNHHFIKDFTINDATLSLLLRMNSFGLHRSKIAFQVQGTYFGFIVFVALGLLQVLE